MVFERPTNTPEMRSTADELKLAGKADGQSGITGIDLSLKFSERLLELSCLVVGVPFANADNFQFDKAMQLENFRGRGDSGAKPLFPNVLAGWFLLIDEEFYRDNGGG